MLSLVVSFGIFFFDELIARADVFNGPLHMSIIWSHDHDSSMVDEKILTKEWPAVCKELGSAFLNPSYILGSGVIAEFDCSGKPAKSTGMSNHIVLEIKDDEDNFTVSVSDLSSGTAIRGALVLSRNNKSILAFRNKKFKNSVVRYVYDAMPMAMKLTEKNYNAADNSIFWISQTTLENTKDVVLPTKVFLYRLIWNDRFQMWRTKIIGEASGMELKLNLVEQRLHQRSEGGSTIQVRWILAPDVKLDFARGETIWVHDQRGPDVIGRKKRTLLESQVKDLNISEDDDLHSSSGALSSILSAPFGSAHIGGRFGMPLLPGAPYGSKARFIGLLGEVRSGPLEGLRLNADLWPRVTEDFSAGEGEFAGSRYIVGWSFRYSLPFSWFADSIDISPAIGEWSFRIDVPIDVDGSAYLSRFDARNALSFGLGLGLEWASVEYLIRLWYSQDFALGLDKSVNSSNVLTKRFGLDGMYRISVFNLGSSTFTTSLLGFVGIDQIGLDRTGNLLESETPVIGSVDLFQIYSGGGISISW